MSTHNYLSSSGTFDESLFSASTVKYSTDDAPQSTFVQFKLSGPYIMVLVVYMSICVVGLAGNLSVIYIILRFPKMKSVTNLYILNLAIADVMFLTGIPFLVTTMVLMRWPFGYVVCKAYWITANVNQFVSSVFYLVLSGDRFVAVYLALTAGRKYRRPDIAKTVCACIWMFATLIMIPIMRHARTVVVSRNVLKGEDIYSCQVVWPEHRLQSYGSDINGTKLYIKRKFSFDANKAFTLYTFAFGYGIPVLLTTVFYFFVLARLKKSGPKDTNTKIKKTKTSFNSILSYFPCRTKPSNLSPDLCSQHTNDDITESKLSLVTMPPAKFSYGKDKCKRLDETNNFVKNTLDSEIAYSVFESSKITSNFECQQTLLNEPSLVSTNVALKDSAQKKRKKKSLRKVTTMVMTIITVYVSCWTPYWVLQLILGFRIKPMPPHTIYISMFVYCLAYANSCMNPILYAFLSDNFKVGFQKLFSSPCLEVLRKRCRSLNPLRKSEAPINNIDKATNENLKVHSEKSFYNPEMETSFYMPTKDVIGDMNCKSNHSLIKLNTTSNKSKLQIPRIMNDQSNVPSGNLEKTAASDNISDFVI